MGMDLARLEDGDSFAESTFSGDSFTESTFFGDNFAES